MSGYLKAAVAILAASMVCGLWSPAVEAREAVLLAEAVHSPGESDPVRVATSIRAGSAGRVKEMDKTYSGEKISIDYKDADLREVFDYLVGVSGRKVVVPDHLNQALKGRVTLKLKDVPWDQALDIILASRNLGVVELDEGLTVCDSSTFSCFRPQPPGDKAARISSLPKKVFTPQHVSAEAAGEELAGHKSERGKIVVIGKDVYVEDKPEAIAAMTLTFKRLDRPGGTPAGTVAVAAAEKEFFGEKISVGYQDADLLEVIGYLAEISGRKIIVADSVKGRVTLKLKDVPWDQVLGIVLGAHNLEMKRIDGVLTVYDSPPGPADPRLIRPQYDQEAQAPPLAGKIFTLKHQPVEVMRAELAGLKSERGRITALGRNIYVEDEPEVLAAMGRIFKRREREARPPDPAPAKENYKELTGVLGPGAQIRFVTPTGVAAGFIFEGEGHAGFVYQDGRVTRLPPPERAVSSLGFAVSDDVRVAAGTAGTAGMADLIDGISKHPIESLAIWEEGRPVFFADTLDFFEPIVRGLTPDGSVAAAMGARTSVLLCPPGSPGQGDPNCRESLSDLYVENGRPRQLHSGRLEAMSTDGLRLLDTGRLIDSQGKTVREYDFLAALKINEERGLIHKKITVDNLTKKKYTHHFALKALNRDGSVAAGTLTAKRNVMAAMDEHYFVRWRADGGLDIVDHGDDSDFVRSMSDDGETVLLSHGYCYYVWTPDQGLRRITDHLRDLGLEFDYEVAGSSAYTAMSRDGRCFAGNNRDRDRTFLICTDLLPK